MPKHKNLYREKILEVLASNNGKTSWSNLAKAVIPKEEKGNTRIEKLVSRELSDLVRTRQVERTSGGLYQLKQGGSNQRMNRPRVPTPARGAKSSPRKFQNFSRDIVEEEEAPRRGGSLPPRARKGLLLRGKITKNTRGFAFLAPENPPSFLKEDVFLNPEEAETLFSGDYVEIILDADRSDRGYSGRLSKIIERGLKKTVARFQKGNAYRPSIAEIDTKDLQMQVQLVNDPIFRDVVDGAAILVQVDHKVPPGSPLKGKILSVIADSMNSTTDDPLVITKHNLRDEFPDAVLKEAEAVPNTLAKLDFKGREDLRDLDFVTIDGADARDFDDAVYAEDLGHGTIRLLVAIADVAHYVQVGTELDKEAYERATSIYFPHRVLPMLPERLSNGICSLNPNEDRLAMVCEMEFDASGKKLKQRVFEAVFQSKHRCVYETLQLFFENPEKSGYEYSPRVRDSLKVLYTLYKKLAHIRTRRGSIDINIPEAKVKIDKATGEVETIYRVARVDAHRLIEEFMIAANEGVSEIMMEHKQEFIYRVHENPEEAAFEKFLSMAKLLQMKIDPKWGKDPTPFTYQKILKEIQGTPMERVLSFQLLRSMKQAFYTSLQTSHFGLASSGYTHFTSPIRRYPDLIVHRLLKAWLHKNKKEAQAAKGSTATELEEAAQHCSQRERESVDAEREFIRIKQVRYAERHLGEEHDGSIVGLTPKGAFIELKDVFVEGFIPLERFGSDFVYNEKFMHIIGKRSGNIIQVGETLRVQIVRTTPHLLQIEMDPVNTKAKGYKKKTPGGSGGGGNGGEGEGSRETKGLGKPNTRDFWTLEDFE